MDEVTDLRAKAMLRSSLRDLKQMLETTAQGGKLRALDVVLVDVVDQLANLVDPQVTTTEMVKEAMIRAKSGVPTRPSLCLNCHWERAEDLLGKIAWVQITACCQAHAPKSRG